jgi:divalent metal cation (Fe/Co/Zn/Cd) transporter
MAIAVGLAFDGYAFSIAIRNILAEMREEKHPSFFQGLIHSKDPTSLTVFVEDLLALIGLMIAGAAITLVWLTGILVIDAVASIIIGALLMVFALLLAYEIKEMLVGEAVTPGKRRKILKAVRSFPQVERIISLKTMHLGPNDVLVTLEINYRDDLIVDALENLNDKIEARILEILPEARVYLEAENR